MAQKISTSSVISVVDTVIESINGHPALAVTALDPYDVVLAKIDLLALDPVEVAALDNTLEPPGTANPYLTVSHFVHRLIGTKTYVTVGPPGSAADFTGTTDAPFLAALAQLQGLSSLGGWIVVLPGLYTVAATLPLSRGVKLAGVHPGQVTVVTPGNYPAVQLADDCLVERLTLQGTNLTSQPLVKIAGTRARLQLCDLLSTFLGCQVAGTLDWVRFCRFTTTGAGLWLQGPQARAEYCSFLGTQAGGAVRFEGSESGILGCRFDPANTGPSYQVVSPGCHDDQLVGCAFLSTAGLAGSSDLGTGTVLYGNVPYTQQVNQNNMLAPLARYTGQPTIATTAVALSNTFTGLSTDLTSIESALDLAVQNTYEERNWYVESADPQFDGLGAPTAGVWTWNGTTLTWPAFQVTSALARLGRWTVAAGSANLAAGHALYLVIDRSLAALDIALTPTTGTLPLPLVTTADAQRFVLAVGLPGGQALWLQGWRLLGALTSFDCDGTPLPLTRYIGADLRCPAPPYQGFAAEPATDLTVKAGAQSALLGQALERTNLRYSPESADAEINTEPSPGLWAAPADVSAGLAGQTPTHLIQLQGTTYGLVASSGLYRYRRDTRDWSLVAGNPLAGPFTAMASLGTGVALLQVDGMIAGYDGGWLNYTPALPAGFTAFASTRPATLVAMGQTDYGLQTPDYTLFTTLDGRSCRFYLAANRLEEDARVAGEFQGLLGPDDLDTGYNTTRDPTTWCSTGDNGFGGLGGLPLGTGVRSKMIVGPQFKLARINWESLTTEAWAFDPGSLAFMSVSRGAGQYYLLGGGLGADGEAQLLGSLGPTDLADFQPQAWLAEPGRQITVTGRQISTGAFTIMVGSFVGGSFGWSTTVLGAANTCQGSCGGVDLATGDLWVLVSNPARGNRPTIWRRQAGVWSQTTFTSVLSVVGDTVTPYGLANFFSFNYSTDPVKGVFSCSPGSCRFFFNDGARSGRPSVIQWVQATSTYTVTTLGDTGGSVVLAQATSTSYQQGLGGLYLASTQTSCWLTKSGTGQVTLFSYREVAGLWTGTVIGTGGTQLPSTNLGGFAPVRTMQSLGCSTVVPGPQPAIIDSIYFWTQAGLYRGLLTTDTTGLLLNQRWSLVSRRTPLTGDVGGFGPRSTYGAWIGASRGGTPSLQAVSRAEPQLPCYGAAQGRDFGTPGLAWYDPGAKLVNPTGSVWAGVNRVTAGKGYLWVGDAGRSTLPVEWTAGGPGDLVVPNLGGALDFDHAVDGSGNVAFCWVDQDNSNFLAFAIYSPPVQITSVQQIGTTVTVTTAAPHGLAPTQAIRIEGSTAPQVNDSWTIATVPGTTTFTFTAPVVAPTLTTQLFTGTGGTCWGAPTLERGGFGNLAGGTYALASTPRIEWTTIAAPPLVGPGYNICAQLASNGQLVYFRRDANGAWSIIRPGTGGNASYPTMTANRGRRPSRPLTLANGDMLVATEDASQPAQLYNVIVSVRYGGSTWGQCFQSPATAGFQYPWLAAATGRYWVLGGHDGTAAKIATATSPYPVGGGGNWAIFTNPVATSYNYCVAPQVLVQGSAVVVASPLATDGAVPGSQEAGVWRFEASGQAYAGGFTAKGRLQSAVWTGAEETYGALGWTAAGQLLVGGTRPVQPSGVPHWGLRDSTTGWRHVGESLLGAGRFLTVQRHFREQWVREPNQNLIVEINRSGPVQTWPNLPVAQRTQGEYLSLRWPFGAGSAAALFCSGTPAVGLTPDPGLDTAAWPQAAALRPWPVVVGSTGLGTGPGPASFYQGAMLLLGPAPGTTNTSYFGTAVLGANNLFKNFCRPALQLLGTHRWRCFHDNGRQFTLVGPVTFLLDGSAVGSHLSFIFTSTGGAVVLDPVANPLTGWADFDAPLDRYVVVIGELRDQAFQLPGWTESYQENLTLGQLEPRELTTAIERWRYRAPTQREPRDLPGYLVAPTSATTVQVQEVGLLAGIQRFTPGQLVARIGLPGAGHYLVGQTAAGPSRGAIQPVVTLWQNLITWVE